MDRGAWQAAVHQITGVAHNLATKPSLPPRDKAVNTIRLRNDQDFEISDKHLKTTMTNIGEGNGTRLQCSLLEGPMDGGAWWAMVHGVAESRTQLNNFTFTFHFHALEKEMATHSSVLAWRIPGTREPGGLPSMGSHRVGHD